MSAKWQHRELVLCPEPAVMQEPDGSWTAQAVLPNGEVAGYCEGFRTRAKAEAEAPQICGTMTLHTGIKLSRDPPYYIQFESRQKPSGPFATPEEAASFALATINLQGEPP